MSTEQLKDLHCILHIAKSHIHSATQAAAWNRLVKVWRYYNDGVPFLFQNDDTLGDLFPEQDLFND